MIDWTSIILALLSGTTVGSIVETIRYRKQNKKLKELNVAYVDIETQMKKKDYADQYFDGMLQLLQKVKENQEESSCIQIGRQEQMMTKLDNLDSRIDTIEVKMSNMEEYLNGEYHKWLAEGKKKTIKKKINNNKTTSHG